MIESPTQTDVFNIVEGGYYLSLTSTRHNRQKGDVIFINYIYLGSGIDNGKVGYTYGNGNFAEVDVNILKEQVRPASVEERTKYLVWLQQQRRRNRQTVSFP